MVIGADNSQAAPRGCPGGELDAFVGYGGAAFIFGKHDVIAEVEGWYSCTSDTPIFGAETGNLSRCMVDDSQVTQLTSSMSANQHAKLMERFNLKAS